MNMTLFKHYLMTFTITMGCGLSLISCTNSSDTHSADDLPTPNEGVLQYVDTRVGTAPSIANVTVTEAEEPLGYVSPIVGNPSALTHWTPQTAMWRERILTYKDFVARATPMVQ